jgi:signal transduction histidine kinase/response regulator of citrate/malate metabolism
MGKSKKSQKKVQLIILLVVIVTALVINLSSLAVGAVFLMRDISRAMKSNMLVTVDIADKYVAKEIQLLKTEADEIAEDINNIIEVSKSLPSMSMMKQICAKYPVFPAIAIFNHTSFLASCGESQIPPELIHEPFMQTALKGEKIISTTMYDSDGELVMYVSVPINDTLVLVAVLPGFHFSELLSGIVFWESGHLFVGDADGNTISTSRKDWVQKRVNYIELAKTDKSYESTAALVKRGISGERDAIVFTLEGVRSMCAFRSISTPNEGWCLGVIAPIKESVINEIPSSLLLMAVITLILSISVAIVSSRILRRPYEEVIQLREDAEAMSSSKSKFLANMSHEIRTPMNSIFGFSELALDSETTPKIREYLTKIKINAEWLLHIINDILDISKVESGKMELEKIPFDMHELFSSCRTLIMPNAVEKSIMLHFYVEPSLGKKPLGDPVRLRQVLVNLLSNAVKFTNTGMVKLNAVLRAKTDKTITMYFEVKDSGVGMTPEQIDKIFDPYAQAEKGTTRKYGGTGLGLPISKDIVEMMGGTLSVESTLGIGSKFSFELVFDTIDSNKEHIYDDKGLMKELDKPAFQGEVLLCEDNPMNQQVVYEHLARVGLKTVVAENGKIGVDLVKRRHETDEKQFDLIFMDMHMPVMDGLEAAAKIKEINATIPIVAMTANVMFNDREVYKQNGMNECVGKPFTSQELWRCLLKHFTPISSGAGKNTNLEANLEFQKKFQGLFVKNNMNKYQEIIDALDSGDIVLAHRIAHSLKGDAGQVGKIILQKASFDVEQNLKEGKKLVTAEQLNILKMELDLVISEFSANKIENM